MNRLEMQAIIKDRVPFLIEQYQHAWKEYEELRQAFVKDYPIERIGNLLLDEYVIGKGADNRSFCYRIERELDQLGRILGATASKFGVYYGKTKSNKTMQYRFASHWGETVDQAFIAVKKSITDLLNTPNNLEILKDNSLSPMFKGKILFLYYPEQFLNIYSKNHLSHFAARLNLITVSEKELDVQKALMDYRASWQELAGQSPFLFSSLLYDTFDYPPKEEQGQIPLLSTAVSGASIQTGTTQHAPLNRTNLEYEELQRNRKIIGDRGEEIVLELEKKRLIGAGKPEFVNMIEHIAGNDDSQGFDILSFEENGTERQIEVKATSMDRFYNGFFLSANELEKSKTFSNYYLYLVSFALSDKPVLSIIKNPEYSNQNDFTLSPTMYNVKINNRKVETCPRESTL